MVRALRNVGHAVLHIDPSIHEDVVGSKGIRLDGNGPVYIDMEYVRPAVDEFMPSLIICLAGGLAFRERDAKALKKRGIVLLGMTLSDPDVFESVKGFADSFDFHTTNAKSALASYAEQGITNTLHFPFGIDRDFVSRRLNPSQQFRADVICLGHARPERVDALENLTRELGPAYTIKAYGRGWGTLGGGVVEGLDLLRASRAGRIHVNFPGTRAGYTNVKCGVFETIASGGLLVTDVFDEMSDYFEYGEQIVGYDSVENLPAIVADLLEDSPRIEQMRLSALNRLIDEHLYERRWINLVERMRNLALDYRFSVSDQQRIRNALNSDLGPCRTVAVSGFYGGNNLGDELILKSLRNGLVDRGSNVQIQVIANNPKRVERDHGVNAVSRDKFEFGDELLIAADAFVLGGGGLWHDYSFEDSGGIAALFNGTNFSIGGYGTHAISAKIRGVPFFAYGLGVGPVSHPDAKSLLTFLARNAEFVVVRDPDSERTLQEVWGSGSKVRYEPDVVYALDLPERELDAAPNIKEVDSVCAVGVNLRRWSKGTIPETDLVDNVVAAITQIAQSTKRQVVVYELPMQNGSAFDRKIITAVLEALPDNIDSVSFPENASFTEYCDRIRKLDALIGMRLHACLLAHRLGIPVVGLCYDAKVRQHFAELDRTTYALPLDAEPTLIAEKVIEAFREFNLNRHRMNVEVLEARAIAGIEVLRKSITELPFRIKVWPIPQTVELPASVESTGEVSGSNAEYWSGLVESADLSEAHKQPVVTCQQDATVVAQPDLANAPFKIGFFEDGAKRHTCCKIVFDFPSIPSGKARAIEFILSSHYFSKKNRGKVEVFVRAGDVEIVQDLASQKFNSRVRVLFGSNDKVCVEVGVRSLVNLKRWNWVEASQCLVEDLRVLNCDGDAELRILTLDPLFRTNVKQLSPATDAKAIPQSSSSQREQVREVWRKRGQTQTLSSADEQIILKHQEELDLQELSNFERWSQPSSVAYEAWNQRKEAMLQYLPENLEEVADYGCGNQYLRRLLPDQTKYIPIDLVARDEETLVLDLNGESYDIPHAHCAFFSGTLEYVYDISKLARKLSQKSECLVFSYSPIKVMSEYAMKTRRKRSWVNHYRASEIVVLFESAGFHCSELTSFEKQIIVRMDRD